MDSIRSNRFWFLTGLILFGAAVNVSLFGVHNFKPIGAMCLFGAAYFSARWVGVLVPLAALFLSDLFQHFFMPEFGFIGNVIYFKYGAFALIAVMGFLLRGRVNVPRVALAAISSSLIFFIVSNFAVWLLDPAAFTRDLAGLMTCYEIAIPFYHLTLLGDLTFAAFFFGAYALAKHRVPVLVLGK